MTRLNEPSRRLSRIGQQALLEIFPTGDPSMIYYILYALALEALIFFDLGLTGWRIF